MAWENRFPDTPNYPGPAARAVNGLFRIFETLLKAFLAANAADRMRQSLESCESNGPAADGAGGHRLGIIELIRGSKRFPVNLNILDSALGTSETCQEVVEDVTVRRRSFSLGSGAEFLEPSQCHRLLMTAYIAHKPACHGS